MGTGYRNSDDICTIGQSDQSLVDTGGRAMRVSVCVPTFERPEMLADLIRTFAIQDHDDRELCISDDSRSESVARTVAQMATPRLEYRHNSENLGYGRNLHAALSMASGDVIVVLGDDDLFASPFALSRYAAAFAAAPHANFAYANLIQVDESLQGTLLYPFFKNDVIYGAGSDAVEHLLLRSILITGIGLRRSPLIDENYPDVNMLFPQVELVGRLLAQGDGIGIGSFLCATRAHADQLGFKAIRGEQMKGGEQHGNIEVTKIIRDLIGEHPQVASAGPSLKKQMLRAFTTNLVNEKILTGNRAVARHARELIKISGISIASLLMLAVCLAAIVLPAPVANKIKEAIRSLVAKHQFDRVEGGSRQLAIMDHL